MRSIISSLNTSDFARIRIGITRPTNKDVTDYVLEKFSAEQLKRLENEIFPKTMDLLMEEIKKR